MEFIQSRGVSTLTANFQEFFEWVATSKEATCRSNSYISNVDQAIEIRQKFQEFQEEFPDLTITEIVRRLCKDY